VQQSIADARKEEHAWPRVQYLWRSEFRTVLCQHMAHRGLSRADAQQIAETVEADLENTTYSVATSDVLRLVDASGHSAYDCEYVALAHELDVTVVTGDETVADLFSDTAVLLEDFARDGE